MSAQELNLEAIAKEIQPLTEGGRKNRPVAKELDGSKGAHISNRFGEVLQAFLETGTVKGVQDITGLTRYTINKYFFGDPEFCKLLRAANETIFLEATKSIRDNQATMVEKAQRLAQDALDEMERLLNESESEHIRFRVAQDLLDRDPRISRTKRIESTGVNVLIEQKILQLAASTAAEIEPARNITPAAGETAHLSSTTKETASAEHSTLSHVEESEALEGSD